MCEDYSHQLQSKLVKDYQFRNKISDTQTSSVILPKLARPAASSCWAANIIKLSRVFAMSWDTYYYRELRVNCQDLDTLRLRDGHTFHWDGDWRVHEPQ